MGKSSRGATSPGKRLEERAAGNGVQSAIVLTANILLGTRALLPSDYLPLGAPDALPGWLMLSSCFRNLAGFQKCWREVTVGLKDRPRKKLWSRRPPGSNNAHQRLKAPLWENLGLEANALTTAKKG